MSEPLSLLSTVLLYGVPLAICLSALIILMLVRNPRLLLHSYPVDVRAAVPPKSRAERRESACWAAIFAVLALLFPFAAAVALKAEGRGFLAIFVGVFGVTQLFNLVDWLILDWLILCTITPGFVVLPGTAGMAGYKNYAQHVRGFWVGLALSATLSSLIAAVVTLIPMLPAAVAD